MKRLNKEFTMESPVLFDVKKAVAIITLNRPKRHNAINREMLDQLYTHLDHITSQTQIRAVILTGKGKSFCAGVDLKAVQNEDLFNIRENGEQLPELFQACGKPIIGAINGHAITGGLEMALCCDFLIASDRAVFIDSHAKLGIHPGWGVTKRLQEAVGRRKAKQMSFTGQPVSAKKACEWGLVNEVVPPEKMLPRALEIAGHICDANSSMLKKIRALIDAGDKLSGTEALDLERKRFISFLNNPEEKGQSAFT